MSEQTANSPAERLPHDVEALQAEAPPGPWDGLRVAAPALLLGLGVLGWLFWGEITAALRVWEASTAYGHCYFVIPIAIYLAWDRRESLIGLMPQPLPWVGLLVLPMGIAWFGVERLGIIEGRQLVFMTMVEALFLAVLGWRFFWALSAPLLYLYFLVPFGAFLTPKLQDITAFFIPIGLRIVGVPFFMDAYQIEIPEGSFYVAEACAGLRFLIASVAFGVLYSFLIYRSPARRAAFMVASILIPIVANGIRAFGIVWMGHLLGSAEAAAADHIIYGWLFFSIVIILLIIAGMPFREDQEPLPTPEPDEIEEDGLGPALRPLRAAILLVLLAAVGPAAAALMERSVAPPVLVDAPQFVVPDICQAPESRTVNGPRTSQAITCAGVPLIVSLHVLPPQVNPNRIGIAWRNLTGEDNASDTETETLTIAGLDPERWKLTATENPGWVTASALWLGGEPRGAGLRDRAFQAERSLRGADSAPVLVSVSYHSPAEKAPPRERMAAEKAIRMFLAAQTDLAPKIVSYSKAAAGK